MKILFITYFFPPFNTIGAVRTGKTAEKLLELGHDVRVISADDQNFHPNLKSKFPESKVYRTNWLDFDRPINLFTSKEKVEQQLSIGKKFSIKSLLIGFFQKTYNFFFNKPDKHIGWYPYAVKKSKSIHEEFKPDVIFSSATPYTSHLIAKIIKANYKTPWVAELRDLWADNHYMKPSRINNYLEKTTLSKADAIVTVSDPLVERLKEKYEMPVYKIQNAFDKSDYEHLRKSVDNNKLKILYTGNLYAGKRDPSPLFDAIQESPKLRDNVKIDFYGNKSPFLDELIKKYSLEKIVEYKGLVSRDEIINLQKQADILLLLTWNNPLEKGVLTGKLFEYIGSAKPILSIGAIHDSASNLIEKYNFGLASNSPSEIESFILDLNSFKYSSENRSLFERTSQVKKLISIFENVI